MTTSSNSCCYCLFRIKCCQSHTPAWPHGIEQLAVNDQLYCEFLERTKMKQKARNIKWVMNGLTNFKGLLEFLCKVVV